MKRKRKNPRMAVGERDGDKVDDVDMFGEAIMSLAKDMELETMVDKVKVTLCSKDTI